MKRIAYWLAKAWVYWISLTPFGLLYLRSDVYAFLLYHVFRYRRKVVRDNLQKSFPEKPPKKIKKIEKKFYRNFCDTFVEFCKIFSMKAEAFKERVTVTNPEVMRDLYAKNKSVFMALHHSSNWEWLWKVMDEVSAHQPCAIYKKFSNHYFDDLLLQARIRHADVGDGLIEDKDTVRVLRDRRERIDAYFILSDQSPRGAKTDYWTEFLHRDTCWFTGLEKLAKRFDIAVVYVDMQRTGRGRYNVTFDLICENPAETEEGFIMEQYVRHLERFLQNNPDNWLWSHRRWKHSRPIEAQ